MSERDDYDSDAPEEFTAEQGIQQDEVIRKVQKESKARIIREGKERRRKWAQRKTPRQSRGTSAQDVVETETQEESLGNGGMLPNDIVKMLAAREKQVFLSDSEDEQKKSNPTSKNKRAKSAGQETVILKDIPPPQCVQSSLDFLKKRKMQVSRSTSVLINSNQALCFLSTSGLLSKK